MSQKENTRFIQTRWPYSRTGTFQPLQIQEDLKWKEHINNVTKKASSTLGFLRRNLQHCPRECRKTAYIALVRSIMEYDAIIWDPYNKKDINKLENLQRRGAHFITKEYKSWEEGSITKMLRDLDLPLLQKPGDNISDWYSFTKWLRGRYQRFLRMIIYPHVTVNRPVKTFPYDSHSNWYLSQR